MHKLWNKNQVTVSTSLRSIQKVTMVIISVLLRACQVAQVILPRINLVDGRILGLNNIVNQNTITAWSTVDLMEEQLIQCKHENEETWWQCLTKEWYWQNCCLLTEVKVYWINAKSIFIRSYALLYSSQSFDQCEIFDNIKNFAVVAGLMNKQVSECRNEWTDEWTTLLLAFAFYLEPRLLAVQSLKLAFQMLFKVFYIDIWDL